MSEDSNRLSIRNPSFCLLLCAFCAVLRAQSGFVKAGNQPIPGATVTATLDTRKFVTTTDANGRYALPQLAEGAWTVEVQMFGFEPAKKPVNYSKTKQADFNLQLREPPGADRLAQFAGNRANGQAGSQLDSQIAGEVNANQAPSVAPSGSSTGGTQNSNEAFLISGSLNDIFKIAMDQ